MNRQKKLSAKIKVDMERRETNQLLSFQDKLAKRKDARMKKLKEKQETEKVKIWFFPLYGGQNSPWDQISCPLYVGVRITQVSAL